MKHEITRRINLGLTIEAPHANRRKPNLDDISDLILLILAFLTAIFLILPS